MTNDDTAEQQSEFSEEELDLLAYGFGFYVQEFNLPDNDPARALLDKLYRLRRSNTIK